MRLVAWNCNMALQRKFDAVLSLRPDVAVIAECALRAMRVPAIRIMADKALTP